MKEGWSLALWLMDFVVWLECDVSVRTGGRVESLSIGFGALSMLFTSELAVGSPPIRSSVSVYLLCGMSL